jgi:hypothetical protein
MNFYPRHSPENETSHPETFNFQPTYVRAFGTCSTQANSLEPLLVMDPHMANGAPSRSESEQLRKQINDADSPRKPADLSHLEPGNTDRKPQAATTIAVRGGRNRQRTATPPKRKAAAAAVINGTGEKGEAAVSRAPRGGRRRSLHPSDERQARHPRDEAQTPQEGASRLQSPDARVGGAQKPAVDFDGLSWPSM